MTSHASGDDSPLDSADRAFKDKVTSILLALTGILFLTGLAIRVIPLFQGPQTLLRQPSEDGFMLLTVARNLAIGLGMTTSEGTITTNGIQPLITFLFTGCYWLVDGDKTSGVKLAMLLSAAIAVAASFAIFRLGQRLFQGVPRARELSALAAALWFASPIAAPHTTNALETGLYCLFVVIALHVYLDVAETSAADWTARCYARTAHLGFWLGLAFWGRNDAVFLIGSACILWLVGGFNSKPLPRKLKEATLIGASATLVALPWMLYNQLYFGSVIPISGKAQSVHAVIGGNLDRLPAKLAEYVSIFGAIPDGLETNPLIQIGCIGLIALSLFAARKVFLAADAPRRSVIQLVVAYAFLLAAYYGVFFGAKHFLARYLAPLSGPIALLSVLSVSLAISKLQSSRARTLTAGALLGAATLFTLALSFRLYLKRNEHMHFQVVEWVADNVPADTWAGAIQTGTLGYFHDRTLNLDGKVNPYALKAVLSETLPAYVVASPIEYLVDWTGIAEWEPKLQPDFELILSDEQRNLAVLKRRAAQRDPRTSALRQRSPTQL